MFNFNPNVLKTVSENESHTKPPLPPENILHTFSKEDQNTILEIVNFYSLCVEKYFEGYNIPQIPLNRFFVFDENSAPEVGPHTTGLYSLDFHTFGTRNDAVHTPNIFIHEMVHFIAKKQGLDSTGYHLSSEENVGEETIFHEAYLALNEGMTELITQDIISLSYKDIKSFFKDRGKVIESHGPAYEKEVEFVQKLTDYNAILMTLQKGIPQEEAHKQVWTELKKGYLTNDAQYLEALFEVFTSDKNEHEKTIQSIKGLEPIDEHQEIISTLINTLDEKIILARTQNIQQKTT